MPYSVLEFQTTPNPHAVKVVVRPSPAPTRPRSYRAPPSHADDPLAAAIMAVPGVIHLLIHDGWITVGKSPSAAWPAVRAGVRGVLESIPEGGP
ncbi:MAG: hypothetical protein HBSAPP03_19450 [Phycisphaerae bacterium]|nr:MAG: hypothetical protein HBSAPP03_19450 [Phycisphaerae bacterium]